MTTTDARIWNRLADGYARKPISDQKAYQHKLDITQSYMHSEMQVLEFGCGTGGTALYHAPKVAHITGIDFSEVMIGHAKTRKRTEGIENVAFEVASIEAWNAPAASYDMILGLSVLHLLRDPQAAVEHVFSLLKPGGYFVSSTVCNDTIPLPIRAILPLARWIRLAPKVNLRSEAALMRGFEAAGFEVIYQWRPNRAAAAFCVVRKPA